jgi:hypothetical protein
VRSPTWSRAATADGGVRGPFAAELAPLAIVTWRLPAPALPDDLEPVLWDGDALLSLVVFAVGRGRLARLPWPSLSFPQANLRTYVRTPEGGGVAILSAVVGSRLAATAGLAGLPVRYGPLRLSQVGARLGLRGDGLDVELDGGAPARVDPALTALVCAEQEAWLPLGGRQVRLRVRRAAVRFEPVAVLRDRCAVAERLGARGALAGHLVATGGWRFGLRLRG